MSKAKKGILLDTHTWIWLFSGSKELSQKTINQIKVFTLSQDLNKAIANQTNF
jgi:PIN domain nuclease of toxin-antitoxin system